jgi:hypothetical protein
MNTPFYGWGLTGRVETTALVLQALEKGDAARGRAQEPDEMISRGLLFLLKNQDPYGVWYSSLLAERVGFRGYGMMLAEIGLPPGAEVDRASLEKAMTASGWDINQYDILPDRVVLYLWPHAGGVRFSFTFKFRCGLKALTAPSILYDYYNPLARAEVEPTEFLVR